MYKIVCSCFWILVVLIASVKSGIMRRGGACTTGEYCVEIKDCPYISKILKISKPPLPRGVAQILRKQHCGFKGRDPLVCCSNNTEQSRGDFFSTVPLQPDVSNHKNLYMLPTEDCGRMAINYRITGGAPAELNEFPWMALLAYADNGEQSNYKFKCDGTVINEFYVLTAAHCVKDEKVIGVRLGEYNLNTNLDCDEMNGYCAPSVQDFNVDEVLMHPNYSKTQANDIALIRLSNPANFDHENVQPICLPVGNPAKLDLVGRYLTVSGWGDANNGVKSPILLQTGVAVVPFETCGDVYRNMKINYKQICAGGKNGHDSCRGDSGGPLKDIVEYDGISRYVQYGIVSYGPRQCGRAGYPAIYTNVAYYMDWILEVITL